MDVNPVFGLVKGLLSPVSEWLKARQARKHAKLQSDLEIAQAVTKAKIERLATGQQADIAWENLSITNSGWKDEWFTIILSIPAVLVFIPGMSKYVYDGFQALKECPDWYNWMLGIAVGSAFGYRKIADFMKLRKGD